MRLEVLGTIEAVGPDGPIDLGGPIPRQVIGLLAARDGDVVSTDQLIDALWPETERPSKPRKNLQVHIANLRRAVSEAGEIRPVIITAGAGYRLDTEVVDVDATHFRSATSRASSSIDSSPIATVETLNDALALWKGVPFGEFSDSVALLGPSVELQELRLGAVEMRIDAELRLGRHHAVLGELQTLTAAHPFRERFRALQMVALYRSGRQAEALRAYQLTRSVLVDELGIEPSAELRELESAILGQDPSLLLASAGEGEGRDRVSTVGGVELRARLGGDAQAAVWRAYQSSPGREVAVRVLTADVANDPEFVREFEPHLRAVSRVEHRGLMTILDAWRDASGAYVVMPLLRTPQVPLSVPMLAEAASVVGGALAALHRRDLVHGRIAADAVLVDAQGEFRLGRSELPPPSSASIAGDIAGLVSTLRSLAGSLDSHAVETLTEGERGRFERVEDFVRAFRRALGLDQVAPERPPVERAPARNPFKGLRAFGEDDEGDFFGREDLVAALCDLVSDRPLVSVVGPSGSGKSSLVMAGLVPAVRDGAIDDGPWLVAEMFPGADPFAELEKALEGIAVVAPHGTRETVTSSPDGLAHAIKRVLPGGTGLLLVIDQFEELYALSDAAARDAFVDGLAALVDLAVDRLRVVVTVRADFFDRPLSHPRLGTVVREGLLAVPAPVESSLALMVSRPAREAGLEIEDGLVPRVVADVAGQPGGLPLLQYALTEAVRRGDGRVLRLADYERSGGVLGALARRADELYTGLSESERAVCREVFGRLVNVADDADDTRRRVLQSELDVVAGDNRALTTVLSRFGGARLLTFDRDPATRQPTVEVAHEALLRDWPRLREWIGERREQLLLEGRLRVAAADWARMERDPDFLLKGSRLAQFATWASAGSVGVAESALLAESRAQADRDAKAVRRRRQVVVAAALVVAAVASVLASLAIVARRDADRNADRFAHTALVNRAISEADGRTDVALALAVEAYERDAGIESQSALIAALAGAANTVEVRRVLPDTFLDASDQACAAVPVPGTLVVQPNPFPGDAANTGSSGGIYEVDAASGEVSSLRFSPLNCEVTRSADGSMYAGLSDIGCMSVIDRSARQLYRTCDHTLPTFLPGGRLLVKDAARPGPGVATWSDVDLERGSTSPTDLVGERLISPGVDAALWFAGIDEDPGTADVSLIDPVTLAPLASFELPAASLTTPRWSADGSTVAVGTVAGEVLVHDAQTGEVLRSVTVADRPVGVAVSPSGQTVAALFPDDRIEVFPVGGGASVLLDPVLAFVMDLTWIDENRLMIVSTDGLVETLDRRAAGLFEPSAVEFRGPGEFLGYEAIVPGGQVPYAGVGTLQGAASRVGIADGAGPTFDLSPWFDEGFGELAAVHVEGGFTMLLRPPSDLVVIGPDGEEVARSSVFENLLPGWAPAIEGGRQPERLAIAAVLDESRPVHRLELVRIDLRTLEVEPLGTVDSSASRAGYGFGRSAAGVVLVVGFDPQADGQVLEWFDGDLNRVATTVSDLRIRWAELAPDLRHAVISQAVDGATFVHDLETGEIRELPVAASEHAPLLTPDGLMLLQDAEGDLALWDLGTGRRIASIAEPGPETSQPILDPEGDAVWLSVSGVVARLSLDPADWRARACRLVPRSLTQEQWTLFVADGSEPREVCATPDA